MAIHELNNLVHKLGEKNYLTEHVIKLTRALQEPIKFETDTAWGLISS